MRIDLKMRPKMPRSEASGIRSVARLVCGLVCVVGLLGYRSTQTRADNQSATTQSTSDKAWVEAWLARTTITKPQAWTPVAVTVQMPNGSYVEIKGKKGTYVFQTAGSQEDPRGVIAFTNSTTGHAWIGPEMDLYLETPSGILGLSQKLGADFEWYPSAIGNANPDGTADNLLNSYDQQKKYIELIDPRAVGFTDLRDILNIRFFNRFPGAMVDARAKINDCRMVDGTLELNIESPTGAFHARIWIDIKTKQVVKAIEDGKRVYPKE
jgi:hypothetical protein